MLNAIEGAALNLFASYLKVVDGRAWKAEIHVCHKFPGLFWPRNFGNLDA